MGGNMSVFLASCYPPNAAHYIAEVYPSSPKWSADQIGDLTGKVVLVTGANSGIGYASAFQLAKHGAKVYAAARSKEKGSTAVDKMNADLAQAAGPLKPGQVVFLQLDLVDLHNVKRAADEFLSKEDSLHVLLNSAGIMTPPKGSQTESGIELQFATNVLGHYALTRYLLPVLLRTAAAAPDGTVRVVNVASLATAMAPAGGIHFDNLAGAMNWGFGVYGQSKMGNVVFANELARRYTDAGIISVSLNPGNLQTDLWRHQRSFFDLKTVIHKYPIEYGMLTQLYAATAPEVTRADSGAYFVPWARRGPVLRKEAHDPVLGARLWEWCEGEMRRAGVEVPDVGL
ncbi:Uncharacterized oxidoreductase [Sparassis crispa]|uniref:Uncharacterized oxidoreductase n=1 Tax=Sparassis crispa TaxID=139825 RepID=A0A401H3D7_9APHY|nr:Uncharacterized oxidoreductase [Sparassis crispa]GBE88955.1 Uncharacterized oxidoreductase [Sparassis crispa]